MGKWERRSAALGGLLIMASAAMYVSCLHPFPVMQRYRGHLDMSHGWRWTFWQVCAAYSTNALKPPMSQPPTQVDTAFVRPEHYRDKWREGRDQRWAQELHHLLLPGVKPEENRPNAPADSRVPTGGEQQVVASQVHVVSLGSSLHPMPSAPACTGRLSVECWLGWLCSLAWARHMTRNGTPPLRPAVRRAHAARLRKRVCRTCQNPCPTGR